MFFHLHEATSTAVFPGPETPGRHRADANKGAVDGQTEAVMAEFLGATPAGLIDLLPLEGRQELEDHPVEFHLQAQ